jgi:hypothetical protein
MSSRSRKRIVCQDFLERGTGAKQFENIGNADTLAANARAASALAWVNGDSLKAFQARRDYPIVSKIPCVLLNGNVERGLRLQCHYA